MVNIYKLLFLQICVILISSQEKNKVDDLFDGLYDKDIYSGYLDTDIEGNKLFYVFTPSQTSKDDPFFLWLNGGPGCSSLNGFLNEIGPVVYDKSSKKFELNKYAWNNNTNLLFIESPSGVGFTKIKDPKMFYDDTIQAISLNIGLQNFFSLFPEYQSNDFYIIGESYAGTYIPHLVKQMIKYSEENENAIKINLKGFLIGNPYTMEITDFEDSMIEFGFSHGLIGYRTFKNYLNECPHLPQKEVFMYEYSEPDNYTFDPIVDPDELIPYKNVTHKCNEIREEIKNQFKGINFYGILNECLPKETSLNSEYKNIDSEISLKHTFEYSFLKMARRQSYLKYLEKSKLRNLKEEPKLEESLELAIDFFPSCGKDLFSINFLNDNTTKKKLGVDENMVYQQCNFKLNYKWGESFDFYKNDLQELTKKGFKAWIFSGAEDIAVATLGTLRWISYMNHTVDEEWKPWFVDGQVAGMEQNYTSGLRFLTIKNCGHMAPEDKPKESKILLDKFIESKY